MTLKNPDLVEHVKEELDDFLQNQHRLIFKHKHPGDTSDLTSEERLRKAKERDDENRGSKKNQYFPNWRNLRIAEIIGDKIDMRLQPSGCFLYKQNGGMSWHTNNDSPGLRIYFSYSYEAGSSFFKYQDPETEEIITDYDGEGWEARMFDINPERPFWHCVGTTTAERLSIGFNSGKQFTQVA